jgi:hypothetical protein
MPVTPRSGPDEPTRDQVIQLGADEVVADRPFTALAHTAEDLAAIRTMAEGLRELLGRPLPSGARPLVLTVRTPAGRQHRAVIGHDGPLRAGRDLAWVGFFATRRAGMDHAPLTAADDELIAEFPRHPAIASYSSLEFADGNWGNLIVVDPPEGREHWRTSEKHAWAARELAPRHYTVIRLHQGVFPGGLWSGRDPIVGRTKYYDFQGPAPWRAERALTSERGSPRSA